MLSRQSDRRKNPRPTAERRSVARRNSSIAAYLAALLAAGLVLMLLWAPIH